MSTCPCCDRRLLRHVQSNRLYWFCAHCWQEMPDLAAAGLSIAQPSPAEPPPALKISSLLGSLD